MRIFTLLSTFASLSYLLGDDFGYEKGTFLRITDIKSKPELNGCYAVVLDDSHLQDSSGRLGVLALLNEKILSFDPNSSEVFSPVDYFPKYSVMFKNLCPFGWNNAEVLSMEEVLSNYQRNGNLSGYRATEITPEQRVVLDRIVQFLWMLCAHHPEVFLDDGINEERARLIGAWILQNYHFTAMQYVANKIPAMTVFLERAWKGIGRWQA